MFVLCEYGLSQTRYTVHHTKPSRNILAGSLSCIRSLWAAEGGEGAYNKERTTYLTRVVTSWNKPRRPCWHCGWQMLRPHGKYHIWKFFMCPLRRGLFFDRTHLYAPSPPSAAHALLVVSLAPNLTFFTYAVFNTDDHQVRHRTGYSFTRSSV